MHSRKSLSRVHIWAIYSGTRRKDLNFDFYVDRYYLCIYSNSIQLFRCIAKASPGTDCHHVVTSSDCGEMFLWDTVDGLCQEQSGHNFEFWFWLLLTNQKFKCLKIYWKKNFNSESKLIFLKFNKFCTPRLSLKYFTFEIFAMQCFDVKYYGVHFCTGDKEIELSPLTSIKS